MSNEEIEDDIVLAKFINYMQKALYHIRLNYFRDYERMRDYEVELKEIECQDSKDITNKIKAVLNVKMKKGEYVGSYAPYGYIKDPDDVHHLIIDEEAAKVVRMIYELTLNGYGRTAIAKKLNELGILNPTGHRAIDLKMKTPFKNNTDKVTYSWCSTTIRDILRNQMYCGDLVQNKGKLISYKIHKRVLVPQEEWIIVKDTHDAIIDRDTFDKVQKAILDRDTRMNTDGKISIFAGHIKCGDCQRAMSKKIPGKYKGQPRNYYHYMCSAYMRSGGEICTKHSIKNDELEKAVLESIKGQIDSKTFNDNRRSYLLENINKCEETLNIKRKLRKEAYEDWKLGIITEKEYNDYTQEYGRQIRENEAYIEENYKELQNLDKMSTSGEWIEYFEKYQNVNSLSRELIDGLIDDIYVYEDKKIKVKFKYEDEYNYLIQYIKRRKGDIL